MSWWIWFALAVAALIIVVLWIRRSFRNACYETEERSMWLDDQADADRALKSPPGTTDK